MRERRSRTAARVISSRSLSRKLGHRQLNFQAYSILTAGSLRFAARSPRKNKWSLPAPEILIDPLAQGVHIPHGTFSGVKRINELTSRSVSSSEGNRSRRWPFHASNPNFFQSKSRKDEQNYSVNGSLSVSTIDLRHVYFYTLVTNDLLKEKRYFNKTNLPRKRPFSTY